MSARRSLVAYPAHTQADHRGGGPPPTPTPPGAPASIKRKRKSAKSKTVKSPHNKGVRGKKLPAIAPPGECAYCDRRRAQSAAAVRRHREA